MSVYYRTLVLAEQGADVDILSYGTGKEIDVPGVRVVRIPRIRLLEPIPIGPSVRKLLLDVLMVLWTIGLLLRNRYHALDAHEEAVFWCRFLKPVFRFKLIYDMHSSLPQQLTNFEFTKSRLLIGAFRWLEDTSLKAADVVITVCPDLRDYALKVGTPPAKVLLIENSVFEEVRVRAPSPTAVGGAVHDPVRFGPGQRVILYAGTFEVYQGVELLVEAFARVSRELPEARLLLVGGTPSQVRKVQELVHFHGLGERCVLTGHLPQSAATCYTEIADVLVSPRIHGTNTPLKIYEHLASGRPMVATAIWSHTQVLDESVCRLVEPDPASLAKGLVDALRDEAGSQARIQRALELFRREYARPVYERKVRQVLELVA
jgi:glycosyltransferase involved in cell wall biosynthesis